MLLNPWGYVRSLEASIRAQREMTKAAVTAAADAEERAQAAEARLAACEGAERGLWADLDAYGDFRPAWPRLVNDKTWQTDIVPWFKRMLFESADRLIDARDDEERLRLQVRCALLRDWLLRPEVEMVRVKMLVDNEYEAGEGPYNRTSDAAPGLLKDTEGGRERNG